MKQVKEPRPLTKAQYLKKFSRSARWRLGAAEAEEAIADYRELVEQEERDESKLVEELGDPVQAAWLLTEAREYKRWMWVFGILALGLFLLAKWNWTGLTFIEFSWEWGSAYAWRGWAILAVGIPLSWVWFQRYGHRAGPLSKCLLLALAAVFALGCATMLGAYTLLNPERTLEIIDANGFGHVVPEVRVIGEVLIDGGTLLPLLGLLALVLARCYDRRWRALYVLCLTVSVIFFIIAECYLLRMDLSGDIVFVRQAIFRSTLPIAAVGLIGTGVALC